MQSLSVQDGLVGYSFCGHSLSALPFTLFRQATSTVLTSELQRQYFVVRSPDNPHRHFLPSVFAVMTGSDWTKFSSLLVTRDMLEERYGKGLGIGYSSADNAIILKRHFERKEALEMLEFLFMELKVCKDCMPRIWEQQHRVQDEVLREFQALLDGGDEGAEDEPVPEPFERPKRPNLPRHFPQSVDQRGSYAVRAAETLKHHRQTPVPFRHDYGHKFDDDRLTRVSHLQQKLPYPSYEEVIDHQPPPAQPPTRHTTAYSIVEAPRRSANHSGWKQGLTPQIQSGFANSNKRKGHESLAARRFEQRTPGEGRRKTPISIPAGMLAALTKNGNDTSFLRELATIEGLEIEVIEQRPDFWDEGEAVGLAEMEPWSSELSTITERSTPKPRFGVPINGGVSKVVKSDTPLLLPGVDLPDPREMSTAMLLTPPTSPGSSSKANGVRVSTMEVLPHVSEENGSHSHSRFKRSLSQFKTRFGRG